MYENVAGNGTSGYPLASDRPGDDLPPVARIEDRPRGARAMMQRATTKVSQFAQTERVVPTWAMGILVTLLLQAGIVLVWGGGISHDVTRNTSDVAKLLELQSKVNTLEEKLSNKGDELRVLREQYNQQEDFIQSLIFYEAAVQKTIISDTRIRLGDLPAIPLRKKSGTGN